MAISDTSSMIEGLPLLYWRWNLGKSGQSMCHDVMPQLWRKSDSKQKHSGG